MKISIKQYAQSLFEVIKAKTESNDLKKTIQSFVKVVDNNNDSYKLGRILNEFQNIWNKEFNVVQAEIQSFHELGSETEQILINYIKNTATVETIQLEKKINKDILGGVIIKYGDKIFDASLRTSLNHLKNSLLK